MIFILSTLINLLLIFAVWRCWVLAQKQREYLWRTRNSYVEASQRWHQQLESKIWEERKKWKAEVKGGFTKMYISAKIAEKTAERAFNLASSANLGVIALQKSLVVPRVITRTQATQNQLAKKTIDELFSGNDDILDFLRPTATDDELEVIDKIQDERRKAAMNGEHKV